MHDLLLHYIMTACWYQLQASGRVTTLSFGMALGGLISNFRTRIAKFLLVFEVALELRPGYARDVVMKVD